MGLPVPQDPEARARRDRRDVQVEGRRQCAGLHLLLRGKYSTSLTLTSLAKYKMMMKRTLKMKLTTLPLKVSPLHCGALEAISIFFFSNSKKILPAIRTHCVSIHTKFQLYSIRFE